MTDSPSEPPADEGAENEAAEGAATVEEAAAAEPADESPAPAPPETDFKALGREISAMVGAESWSEAHDTVKVKVDRHRWVQAITEARDEAGLDFFSWLSAVDWSKEVAGGEQVEDPDALEERYELLCALSTIEDGRRVLFTSDVPKDDPAIDSLVEVFPGASWHEREAAEMFGIDFLGHSRLIKLYLPDAFEGHPLRKSFPLLSREVKPWPGKVDVEGMPGEAAGEDESTDQEADE